MAAKPKTRRYTIAEEAGDAGGLVAVEVKDPLPRPLPKTTRVRFAPPDDLLREDGRVYDLDAARALVDKTLLPPILRGAPAGVSWTDTVIGLGRVTVSVKTTTARAAAHVAAAAVAPPGWRIEEVLRQTPAARLRRLVDDVPLYAPQVTKADASVARAVGIALRRSKATPVLAPLAVQIQTKTIVSRVLRALDAALPLVDPALRDRVGASSAARLCLVLNSHPRMRSAHFVFTDGDVENDVYVVDAVAEAVCAFLGATVDDLRRAAGVAWQADLLNLRFKRVVIDASS